MIKLKKPSKEQNLSFLEKNVTIIYESKIFFNYLSEFLHKRQINFRHLFIEIKKKRQDLEKTHTSFANLSGPINQSVITKYKS